MLFKDFQASYEPCQSLQAYTFLFPIQCYKLRENYDVVYCYNVRWL